MRCDEIMKTDPVWVTLRDDAKTAARRMRDEGVGFLPVCDDDRIVTGALTDRDLAIRLVAEGMPASTSVNDVMSREVVACRVSDDIHFAERLMARNQKSRILVLDDAGRLAGVISLSDIAQHERNPDRTARTLREIAEREAHGFGPLSAL